MKMTRDYIRTELNRMNEEKEKAWLMLHPTPAVPTDKEILSALRAGSFTLRLPKCGCNVRDINFHGYARSFPIHKMMRVPLIEAYFSAAGRHEKKYTALKKRLKEAVESAFQFCYYGEGSKDSIAAVAKLEAFRRFKP